jgi:hypothetical protein
LRFEVVGFLSGAVAAFADDYRGGQMGGLVLYGDYFFEHYSSNNIINYALSLFRLRLDLDQLLDKLIPAFFIINADYPSFISFTFMDQLSHLASIYTPSILIIINLN